MQSHYRKVSKPNDNFNRLNIVESIVYSLCYEDRIRSSPDIYEAYLAFCAKNPTETKRFTKSFKDISVALENLTRLGFLKHVSGERLLRLF